MLARARARGQAGPLSRGDVVGRYVVLAQLGAGGMGAVYAAYDPELDRKVALKMLLDDAEFAANHAEARARLLREAQALAKFAHPEIVGIHDVGEHGAAVWIAMEFVDGRTLGAWAQQAPRPWREVLDVMCAAGRGVEAAHAAGMIHRDLKPENIMIAADGRARVMDFGLTRAQTATAVVEPGRGSSTEAIALTGRGSMLGTPAYMSPEQFLGVEITAAADQFSFCVTLWELLFGERPYAGDTSMEIAASVLDGTLRPPPKGRGVPAWLRRACERGLAREPAKRWPSMQALLAELQRGRARARTRTLAAGLAVLAAAVVVPLGLQRLDRARRLTACDTAGAEITATWNDVSRAGLHHALVATEVSYAAQTADKLMPWLDDYAQQWQAARTAVCVEATVDATPGWTPDLLDRSVWCLDEGRAAFVALVDELAGGGPQVLGKAVTAAASLTRVDSCRDVVLLARLPAPPVDGREAIAAVRAGLSRAAALEAMGEFPAGLQAARASLAEAEALGWPPLTAAARHRIGTLLEHTGAFAEAEQSEEAAYFEATHAGALELAADAANALVLVVGLRQARHAEALRWSRHAGAVLASLPDATGLRQARHLTVLAHVHQEIGDYAQALTLHAQALALDERALGPEHPRLVWALNNLANTHFAMGAYDEARTLYERSASLSERAFGANHPTVSIALNNLANVHYATGAYEQAKALYGRALAIDERALGPAHTDVAAGLSNLGSVHYVTGSYAEAKALHLRALAIDEQALGPEHPNVATSLNNLGITYTAMGAYAEAEAVHSRALAIREKALGPAHASVGNSLCNLGEVRLATGAFDEARALFERARQIHERALGPEHPKLGTALLGLAKVELAAQRPVEAVALAERAVALRAGGDAGPAAIADARFVLAKALWATGPSRVAARAAAEQARDGYRRAEAAGSRELVAVDAWLAAHPADEIH